MKDALDNNIIIGNTYGASYSSGGRTTIVVGKAIKIGKAKTTILADSVRFLHLNQSRWNSIDEGTKHPIFHERLFPVYKGGVLYNEWCFQSGSCRES